MWNNTLSSQECPIRLRKFSRMRLYYTSKTATTGPGADSGACSSIVTCPASRARSQRPALLQAAAETTACAGKEGLKVVRRVRHYKDIGRQEWPLAGRATARVFYTVSVSACLFVGERFFQNVYGRPLVPTSPFTLFAR